MKFTNFFVHPSIISETAIFFSVRKGVFKCKPFFLS